MQTNLPACWRQVLREEIESSEFRSLSEFVDQQRQQYRVFPAEGDVFRAFELTPYENTRVVVLGQDPYHGSGQAHGLAFSVPRDVPPPPSLVNIFKELQADMGIDRPQHGCLESWARQGVLLLNTVLSVREAQAHSHRDQGWERLTDRVIARLADRDQPTVFVLWGKPAQRKRPMITGEHHLIIESAHPSPLSARRGFFGSRPFSRINEFLRDQGQREIRWEEGMEQ